MRCLCCGKEINETASLEEKNVQWHNRCISKFFGVKTMPYVEISAAKLKELTKENTTKGFTVTGVQKKLSLHLDHVSKNARLTLVGYPAGYILKPQTEDYPHLPEAEYLAMQMAEITKIRTVPYSLIKSKDNEYYYITKRIDRENGVKFAMEDFCQLDERLTEDKYKGSYEKCGKLIQRYSSRAMLDITEMYKRVIFSFCIGNSDMHLKNFSLIEEIPYTGEYTLSKAYDLLPVNVVNPADKDQMALTVNGKKRNIRKKDFLLLAENCGLTAKVAERLINSVIALKDQYIMLCLESYLPNELKKNLSELIEARCSIFK